VSAGYLRDLRLRWQAAAIGTQEWDDAAAAYATTREGAIALTDLQQEAVARMDIEMDVALETALDRGARVTYADRVGRIAARSVPLAH